MAVVAFVGRKVGGIGVAVKKGFQCREIQSFSLPELPYEYSALEPVISGEIMSLHHQKHHQAYVTNYNKALEQLEEASAKRNAEAIVSLQSAIKFNGGGIGFRDYPKVTWITQKSLGVILKEEKEEKIIHSFMSRLGEGEQESKGDFWTRRRKRQQFGTHTRQLFSKIRIAERQAEQQQEQAENADFLLKTEKFPGHINHSVFWKNLAPVKEGGGEPPKGALAKAIDTQFGSLNAVIEKMNAGGAAVQGSGWVWLGLNKDLKSLMVETTQNQDPLVTKGLLPLLGIDVWEHAYYLQYKNVRPDYLKNIWKVMNWKYAEEIFEKEINP